MGRTRLRPESVTSAEGPLARWYAEPLGPEEARELLERCRQRMRAGRCRRAARLAAMVALWWQGEEIEGEHRLLARACGGSPRCRALNELIFGQLLVSRRLAPGSNHLERGLKLAAVLLTPRDYFRVAERHALLAWLPLGPQPREAAGLHQLLTEAAVIRRLRTAIEPRSFPKNPADTIG